MLILAKKIVLTIIGGLICFALKPADERNHGCCSQQITKTEDIKGYRDLVFYSGKFLAVGTEGRIDYINNSGERTPAVNTDRNDLNCAVSKDQMLVAAGEDGTILFSSDGNIFSKVKSGIDKNINGIALKNELLIACADKGTILFSKDGKSWNSMHLEVKGNIVSVTANDSFFIGITDTGEIIKSDDGLDWEITDYNKEYSGYNKSCIFKKVLTATNRILIIGKHDDGSPALLFSSLGNVWTERTLTYKDDHGVVRFLANEPNGITYDLARDQFILACDNGELFILPSCTKCNESFTVSTSDIYAVICTRDLMLSAGENFYVNIVII